MGDDSGQILKKLSVRVDGLRRAMEAVMSGTTPDHAKWGAFKSFARAYDAFAQEYRTVSGDRNVHIYDTGKMKGSTDTVWPVQKEIFDTIYADVLILSNLLSAYDVGISASISEIQDLLVSNLRKVIFEKPDKERDVQNAMEALLVGRGYQKSIDYEREAGRVKFSGKEFVPDFIFANISLAAQVKLVKEKHQMTKCVEEMSADVPAYLSVYKNILFCVYDLGVIRDVGEFQEGLEKQNGVRICVIKH
jgi:REase_DpnII-MboI